LHAAMLLAQGGNHILKRNKIVGEKKNGKEGYGRETNQGAPGGFKLTQRKRLEAPHRAGEGLVGDERLAAVEKLKPSGPARRLWIHVAKLVTQRRI